MASRIADRPKTGDETGLSGRLTGMYVPTLPRHLGDASPPNATPWVAGALLLMLAVVVPRLTARIPGR